MLETLSTVLTPDLIVGLCLGFILGALAVLGIVTHADAAHERRQRLDAERRVKRLEGELAARAWGDAANDDRTRTARSQMRGGAR